MGSWAATCAVSRLAINPGDDVFYIYASKTYTRNTYGLLQEIVHDIRWKETYTKSLESNAKLLEKLKDEAVSDEFADYMKESQKYYENLIRKKTVVYGWGEYDDYGGVEGVDFSDMDFGGNPEEDSDDGVSGLVLIRGDVAIGMIRMGEKMIKPSQWEPDVKKYYDNSAYCVAIVAHSTRLQLFGHQLLGRQYPEVEEYKEILKLQWIIFKETIREYIREIHDTLEYENWSWRISVKYNLSKLFLRKKDK